MSSGRIVQIIGAVIDVEFDRDNVPKVYDALSVEFQWAHLRSAAATWGTAWFAPSPWVFPMVCLAA